MSDIWLRNITIQQRPDYLGERFIFELSYERKHINKAEWVPINGGFVGAPTLAKAKETILEALTIILDFEFADEQKVITNGE